MLGFPPYILSQENIDGNNGLGWGNNGQLPFSHEGFLEQEGFQKLVEVQKRNDEASGGYRR